MTEAIAPGSCHARLEQPGKGFEVQRSFGILALAWAVMGCQPPPIGEDAEPECSQSLDCVDFVDKPYCAPETQTCEPVPPGHLLGWSDGEPGSIRYDLIYEAERGTQTTGIAFRPQHPKELWITLRQIPRGQCVSTFQESENCLKQGGAVAIVSNVERSRPRVEIKQDVNAWHFMRQPSGIAFGDHDFFATCPEARTCNFEDEVMEGKLFNFAGPTLWTASESIFALNFPGKNGSHMDMMHFSPLCMGLAHEWQNAYWIFNGHHSSIDRYDFKADHGPGEDDHSDGEILRYIKGEVRRVPGVSSQMHYDKEEDYLYIADTGNRRILRLDARSGEQGAILLPNYDEGRVHHEMDNAEFIELVNDERIMGRPSGLFLDDDGTIYVSDPEYSEFKAFDKEGNLLRMLKTDFPLDSLGTLAKGGDGRLYFTQPQEGRVYRIEFDPHRIHREGR